MKSSKYTIVCLSDKTVEYESADTIDGAESRARQLAAKYPGRYIDIMKPVKTYRCGEMEVINYRAEI